MREHPEEREERDGAERGAGERGDVAAALGVDPPAEQHLGEEQDEREDGERTPDLDAEAAADDGGHQVVEAAREAEIDRDGQGVELVLRERLELALARAPARVDRRGDGVRGRDRVDELVRERHEERAGREGRPLQVERQRRDHGAPLAERGGDNRRRAVGEARGNVNALPESGLVELGAAGDRSALEGDVRKDVVPVRPRRGKELVGVE